MVSLANKPAASRVWFDDSNLWIELKDGRQLSVPLAYFPRLARATAKQLAKCEMSGGGTGLHWDALDEDISVPALLMGHADRTAAAQTRTKATRSTKTRKRR